jgi:hypothetical protein
MRKTEDLINSLSNELKPVRPLETPLKRIMRWSIVSITSILVGVALFGVRENFEMAIQDGMWWVHTFLMALIAVSSAASAIIFSVPGRDRSFFLRWMPLFTLFAWIIAILSGVFQESTHVAGAGFVCVRDIIVMGAIPGIALFFMILQGVVFKRPMAGFFGFLAIAALGSMGTQFICASDSPMHLLVWHFLPVFLLGLVGSFVGNLIFKRPF